jgi:transposase
MDGKLKLEEAVDSKVELAGEPVNVSVSESGTEEAVIGKERWEELRRMRAAGMALSQIARESGLDRKTVRRCLRQSQWQPYRRAGRSKSLLAEHLEWLAQRAPQVNFSAQILFQELRAGRGYSGGYDTVRNAVRPLRTEAAAASLTQRRFETEPGQQAQVDWGQVRVRFVSGPAQVHVFVMTLGYSRRAWAEGYRNEQLAALLAAHEHAFAHFGGCPAEILYDRMRTVTVGSEEPGKPRWNSTFEAFARYWGFEPRAVPPLPRQDQGQGRVRGEVRQGQLPARAGVRRSGRLQRPACRLAQRGGRCASARHHPRAAHRALCPRGGSAGAGCSPSGLPR